MHIWSVSIWACRQVSCVCRRQTLTDIVAPGSNKLVKSHGAFRWLLVAGQYFGKHKSGGRIVPLESDRAFVDYQRLGTYC
jgi:hypothetical protein